MPILGTSKYPTPFSKEIAIKLLKIFSPIINSSNDYKFDGNDPNELEYRFYPQLIKQDRRQIGSSIVLPKLVTLSKSNRMVIRIFSDDGRLCVEIKVRPKIKTIKHSKHMSENKKLFGNVGGNQFRLLTEGMEVTVDRPQGTEQVREGLKKVLANGGSEISYHRLQNVGYGYIKDITTAAKCAIREARELAEEFGYKDDENNAKFVKEDGENVRPKSMGGLSTVGSESDMSNPAEKREVQIGKELIKLAKHYIDNPDDGDARDILSDVVKFGNELIQMHSGGVAHRTGFHQ